MDSSSQKPVGKPVYASSITAAGFTPPKDVVTVLCHLQSQQKQGQ
jgi:hypothetical protein